jgi:diguanylate cyclase (GGDEF)-like protein
LELSFDAASNVRTLEALVGLPLRLVASDAVVYQSESWPQGEHALNALIVSLPLDAPGDKTLVIQTAKDESGFYGRLEQTRYAVYFAAAAVTLLFVLIAIAFLEHIAVGPLRRLVDQLRDVQSDESQLGSRISTEGNADTAELAGRFNAMTAKLEELYVQLDRMAYTDPLTQLPNRTFFQSRLRQAVAQAQQENRTFALFIMDLDRFKEINDTLGHHVGDILLQQVAIRLRDKLRDSDTLARMGGDEFAVLLPTVTAKQADMAARMLVQSLRSPFIVESHQLDVGVSIGVALYPDHGVDANTLIQRADVAMYAAKQSGCGQLFYDPQMDRHHPAQLTLMGELRHAVEQEQFILYYQPKIGLKTNRIVGVEALVRWRHPSGNLIMPEAFIPLLEQTGLIRGLTGWVTHEALRMASELRRLGFELPVAVNVSARDLQNNGLAEQLAEQLAAHQATADWLELEITESAVMSDVSGARDLLDELASMGFKLVIDDFGTGYSSLGYLKRLPVNAVKIDKSFVMGMARDENDAAIVYTSIDLSHNLGLQVVAEGVDDEGVLMRLRTRGCDAVQGMYLSRPLPAEELIAWLAKSNWGLPATRLAC